MHRRWIRALTIAAVANLFAGILLSLLADDRASDLWLLRLWTEDWLVRHADLYRTITYGVDYPPWAIVTFAPLGLMSEEVVLPVWTALNAAAIVVLPFLAARLIAGRSRSADLIGPALLILCWGSTRALVKSTLGPFLAGIVSALVPGAPLISGVLLGLAAAKPQIALPFVLATLVARRFRVLAVALVFVCAQIALYCWWNGSEPIDALVRWLHVLPQYYLGPGSLTGQTSVRFLLTPFAPPRVLDVIMVGWLIAGVIVLIVLGRRFTGAAPDRMTGPVVALGCLLSLMCFFHLTNNLILLIPAFLLVYFGPDPWPPYARVTLLVVVQILLTFELDMRAAGLFPNTVIADVAGHLKRMVVFLMLGYLAAQLSVRRGMVEEVSAIDEVTGVAVDRTPDAAKNEVEV